MNNMPYLPNTPPPPLPLNYRTYETAEKWYVELAEMHIAQLISKHDDLVTTADLPKPVRGSPDLSQTG